MGYLPKILFIGIISKKEFFATEIPKVNVAQKKLYSAALSRHSFELASMLKADYAR